MTTQVFSPLQKFHSHEPLSYQILRFSQQKMPLYPEYQNSNLICSHDAVLWPDLRLTSSLLTSRRNGKSVSLASVLLKKTSLHYSETGDFKSAETLRPQIKGIFTSLEKFLLINFPNNLAQTAQPAV